MVICRSCINDSVFLGGFVLQHNFGLDLVVLLPLLPEPSALGELPNQHKQDRYTCVHQYRYKHMFLCESSIAKFDPFLTPVQVTSLSVRKAHQ